MRDCGLFVIANALSICIARGEDPAEQMFEQKSIRRDLVQYIDTGVLGIFKAHQVTMQEMVILQHCCYRGVL